MPPPYIADFGTVFVREKLVETIAAVSAFPQKRIVVWDLSKQESVPWGDLMFVAEQNQAFKPAARRCIEKSMVYLPGPGWRRAMDALFAIVRPAAPYEVYAGPPPPAVLEMQEGEEKQQRSVPK